MSDCCSPMKRLMNHIERREAGSTLAYALRSLALPPSWTCSLPYVCPPPRPRTRCFLLRLRWAATGGRESLRVRPGSGGFVFFVADRDDRASPAPWGVGGRLRRPPPPPSRRPHAGPGPPRGRAGARRTGHGLLKTWPGLVGAARGLTDLHDFLQQDVWQQCSTYVAPLCAARWSASSAPHSKTTFKVRAGPP